MKVTHDGKLYIVEGEKIVVYGGTLQFFRVPRDAWRDRLEKMKKHGLNTVDTYVAWNWHEPEEGKFDFIGETHPQRDLIGFLELAQDLGLYVIIRPGPYICGEWKNGGIPEWLINKHPEILARGPNGPLPRDIYYPPITYLHPTYLGYVMKWYEQVFPIIKDYLYTKGGPIINVTIDDEPSYWETIFQAFLTDYNDVVVKPNGLWHKWLRETFSLDQLEERYKGKFSDYTEIAPPKDFSEPLPKIIDWHHFKIWMTNEYVKTLYHKIQEYVDVPVSILDPYLLLAAWRHFYNYIRKNNLDIHLWTEFWYSFYRSFDFKEDRLGHVYYKIGTYRYYVNKLNTPPLSIETQSSLANVIEKDEAELLYGLLPSLGIHNINYYLYVGGENPRGYESHNGVTWDVYSPIGLDGSERQHVEPIKWIGEFLKANKDFAYSPFNAKVAFAMYEPYEALNLWGHRPENFKESVNLNEYLFGERGLLTLLAMSNVPFDVIDLENTTVEEMLRYEQIWVYSLDFMGREVQDKLAEYVEKGGNLVILPMLPYLDENLNEYRKLEEFLGVKVEGEPARDNVRLIPFVSVDADGIDRMIVRNVVREVKGGEPIAWVEDKVVGAIVRKGKGSAVILGFRLQYFSSYHDMHRKFVDKILELQGVERDFKVTDRDMIVIPRGNYLAVINPRGHAVKGRISYNGIEFPKLIELEMKNRGVLFLPVNVKYGSVEVVYSTATVTRYEDGKITFRNHLSNTAEVAIKGDVEGVENGEVVEKKQEGEVTTLVIRHPGEFVLLLR
ncbi:beta-galactosidase [Thermococcus chitonophagus]|uniref:Beta-galactosidase n=1 Tax=Thermococcus chitonophagus TaxID=54262 RepID=A0A160VTD9_9EURY|nr:exo-beta-D-glucosaminidase [Thermococcus chitonophagus]ASJ17524.1 beta-galactosidase [Thermococcus chitonophagus]CUX78180.1 Beta-galactosidase [Thermococcus chitonophagus]